MSFLSNPRLLPQRHRVRGQGGFTLIELMVGVVLGMITVTLIAQMYALSEGQKRNTTTGSDAQVSGVLAMYSATRELKMAGYGLSVNPKGLGCPTIAQFGSQPAQVLPLAPVVITAGGSPDGVSDTVRVLMSNTTNFSVPARITENHTSAEDHFVVKSSTGFNAGDVVVAVPAEYTAGGVPQCNVYQVAEGAGNLRSDTRVPHAVGASAPWNERASSNEPADGFKAGGSGSTDPYLVNLGAMLLRTYQISNQQSLQSVSVTAATGTATTQDLYPQVVLLRALYGKDTNGDNVVDLYDAVTPADAAGWGQVKAVRIAIVARSGEWQREDVTTAAPQWDVGNGNVVGAQACGDSQCLALNLNHLAEWRRFRYRVFETVVPLRNVLWNS